METWQENRTLKHMTFFLGYNMGLSGNTNMLSYLITPVEVCGRLGS